MKKYTYGIIAAVVVIGGLSIYKGFQRGQEEAEVKETTKVEEPTGNKQPLIDPDLPVKEGASFDNARTVLVRDVYNSRESTVTMYCGCKYTAVGRVDLSSCGYVAKSNPVRASIIAWEHVIPSSKYSAKDSKKHLDTFEGDLHNLVPVIGEVKDNRQEKDYGLIEGEKREFGTCDVEVNGVLEPRDQVRGNIARKWLYLAAKYKIPLSEEKRKMFQEWDISDPPTEGEKTLDKKIGEFQGDRNPYIGD